MSSVFRPDGNPSKINYPDIQADTPLTSTQGKMKELRPEREDSSRFTFNLSHKWTVLKEGAGNLFNRIFNSRVVLAIKNLFMSVLFKNTETPVPSKFERPPLERKNAKIFDPETLPQTSIPSTPLSTEHPKFERRNTVFSEALELDLPERQDEESPVSETAEVSRDQLISDLRKDLKDIEDLIDNKTHTSLNQSESTELPQDSNPIEEETVSTESLEPQPESLETEKSDGDASDFESEYFTDEGDSWEEAGSDSWEVANSDSFVYDESLFDAVSLQHPDPLHVHPGQPVGIPNSGNACYRNSIVQALTIMEPFMARLAMEPAMRADEEPNKFFLRSEVISAFKNLLEKKNTEQDATLIEYAEQYFGDTLFENGISTEFDASERPNQQDAAAFAHILLSDLLGLELKEQISRSGKVGKATYSKEYPEDVRSPVVKIEINGARDLQTLIDITFHKKIENQDKNNPWDYSEDVFIEDYESQTKIVGEAPEIFALQLERYKVENGAVKKVETKIALPKNGVIDLAKAYQSDRPLEYTLKSFVFHDGKTASSGHYFAFVLHEGVWYVCDDSVVKPVSPREAEKYKKVGYIYFFEKKRPK